MRSFIISLILFIVVILCIILNAAYVTKSCKQLDHLSQEISAGNNRNANIQEISEYWKNNRSMLGLSIRMNEIERMNDLIESLRASYSAQNESEIQKSCALISELALDLSRYERISVKSIS